MPTDDDGKGLGMRVSGAVRVVRRAALVGPRRLRQRLASRRPGPHDLADRVTILERDMQESRRLSRRLAELVDVVETLVLPMVRLDDAEMRALLGHYADTL